MSVALSSIREIERELGQLRDASTAPGAAPLLRTSVMTHIAWVPEPWAEQARGTLSGLAERHPSRTILLFPCPDDPEDVLEGEVDFRCFVRGGPREGESAPRSSRSGCAVSAPPRRRAS